MSEMTSPPAPAARRAGPGPVLGALKALASLRLTVVLFVLSVVLVFVGTLAQKDAGNWTVVNSYFRSFYVWVPFQIFFPERIAVRGGFPFPGGYILGGALLINLLAAHAVRFRLSWKRSGILVLHAGLILLLVGELLTGLFAVEGNMTIEENGSSNYLEHRNATELAIIDPSAKDVDDVVVVPGSMLRRGGRVTDAALPFDVEVQQYMVNSAIQRQIPLGTANPATAGDGLQVLAVERPEVSGADPNQTVDLASAYVTFRKKGGGEALGTYLLSVWLSVGTDRPTQPLTVDGKTYEVSLRFKRTYKPYTLHLFKFTHDLYQGTEVPKDYASAIRLEDPSRHEDREVLIYMNHPLRYHGETFYQTSFVPGDNKGDPDKGTILQVVRNPSWWLPYAACAMVSLGMLGHFVILLVGFLNKPRTPALPAAEPPPEEPVERPQPVGAGAPKVGGGYTATQPASAAARAGRFTHKAARKAVAAGSARPAAAPAAAAPAGMAWLVPWIALGIGVLYFAAAMTPPADRDKDFQYQEFASLPVVDHGRVKPLDTFARTSLLVISDRQTYLDDKDRSGPAVKWLLDVLTHSGSNAPIFRIENEQVLDLFRLKPRPGLRYSVAELSGRIQAFMKEVQRLARTDSAKYDVYDNKLMELKKKLDTYVSISQGVDPMIVPPSSGDREWQPLAAFAGQDKASSAQDKAARAFDDMLDGYSRNDPAKFNKALADYRQAIEPRVGDDTSRAGFEQFYNNFQPFFQCAAFYVLIFVIGCISWITWGEPLRRAAFWLAVLTFAIHTAALIGRMYIMNRWLVTVTNLYSSAIFIGWVAIGASLVLEAIFRNGIGVVAGSVIGAVTGLIAHLGLASSDTMEVLQAVLDTNFWLATHVTCVTIGYSATYLAGFLGMAYIVVAGLNVAYPGKFRSVLQPISQMIYGVVCFAMLFSFTGTVLGGIWADQSWGRFWGWDTKENGALLIVIWNALILHARWAGLVKAPGIAVLAVLGNVITSWSWFGTNMLGVGLHSYGFMSGAVWILIAFVLLFLAWAGVGVFVSQLGQPVRPRPPAA
jgi:ABC-type transport system involved in cytochrome c biogenesis permease subunit